MDSFSCSLSTKTLQIGKVWLACHKSESNWSELQHVRWKICNKQRCNPRNHAITSLPWLALLVLQMQKSVCGKFNSVAPLPAPSPWLALTNRQEDGRCSIALTITFSVSMLDAFVVLVTKEANATQRAPAKLDSLVRFRDEHVPFGHIHSGTSEFCWASFPETPDWRSHLRSLLGLCTMTACHTVSTGTTANWSSLSLSVSLTRLLRIDMQILNCGNYWVSLGALQGKQLKLSQAHNFHLRSAALMDSKSGTPWVNLSGQDSMCHSCTAGSTGAEQLWCRLCEMEVYILGEGLCSTMRCSWHLIFQQRSTMSQMCVDLTCHLSVSFRMFIKMSLVLGSKMLTLQRRRHYVIQSPKSEGWATTSAASKCSKSLWFGSHRPYILLERSSKNSISITYYMYIYIYRSYTNQIHQTPNAKGLFGKHRLRCSRKNRKPVPVMSGMLFPAWSIQIRRPESACSSNNLMQNPNRSQNPKSKIRNPKSKIQNPRSKIQNPKSKIQTAAFGAATKRMDTTTFQNPKSKIQNPKSKIQDPKSKIQNPRSKIQNPKSKIQNPKSKIQNPKSKIQNPKSKIQDPRSKIQNPKSKIQNPKSKIQNPNGCVWGCHKKNGYYDIPKSKIQDPKSKIQNPRSKIQNPKSKIQNPKSKIQNPKSKIQNPKSKIQDPRSKIQNPKSKQPVWILDFGVWIWVAGLGWLCSKRSCMDGLATQIWCSW